MKTLRNTLLATVGVASSLALGWTGGACTRGLASADADAQPSTAAQPAPEAREIGETFVSVAERLAPAVVRITPRQAAAAAVRSSGPDVNPFQGTPFEDFFEHFWHGQQEPPGPRLGMGSGVVIDDRGHILTNNHVVENATELKVTF